MNGLDVHVANATASAGRPRRRRTRRVLRATLILAAVAILYFASRAL